MLAWAPGTVKAGTGCALAGHGMLGGVGLQVGLVLVLVCEWASALALVGSMQP